MSTRGAILPTITVDKLNWLDRILYSPANIHVSLRFFREHREETTRLFYVLGACLGEMSKMPKIQQYKVNPYNAEV